MLLWRWSIYFVCLLLLSACAGVSMHGLQGASVIPSANYDYRRPSLVVLHHTGSSNADRALRTLTVSVSKVSAHYLISRSGKIMQLVDERQRAWHAGVSKWHNISDVNSVSIGIELDNNGKEPYSRAQINALIRLLHDLKLRYRLPQQAFVGHADVAPGRKVDPSSQFPWAQLAAKGFGLWCSQPWPIAPVGFSIDSALTQMGYDTTNLQAARHSFLLHYAQGQSLSTQQELDLAYCITQQLN